MDEPPHSEGDSTADGAGDPPGPPPPPCCWSGGSADAVSVASGTGGGTSSSREKTAVQRASASRVSPRWPLHEQVHASVCVCVRA